MTVPSHMSYLIASAIISAYSTGLVYSHQRRPVSFNEAEELMVYFHMLHRPYIVAMQM
jgi:hypothetical protein